MDFLRLIAVLPVAHGWDNGQELTPTLGFSTWNWHQTCTTREMLEPLVDAMVSRKLVAAGYNMFMADCAGPSRATNGSITLPEVQWPGGVQSWNAFLHSKGMRAGFYTDYGTHGCCACSWQTNPGTTHSFGDAGYIQQDMNQLAGWGTDYIKVDSCQPVAWRDGLPDDPGQYARFRDAIGAAAKIRPMTYSIIGFKGNPKAMAPPADGGGPFSWQNKTGNSWRTTNDISYSWQAVVQNLDTQEGVPGIELLAGPGAFNDLDMLMFANPNSKLTPAEGASHLGLWAILKAPLLLSTSIADLTSTGQELDMLTNTNMLAVNQDKMAVQATRVFPRAQYVARGAVYGAPSVPSYSLPLGQNWAMKPGKAPQSKQLRNLGQAVGGPELNLCLSAGTDGVTLASCEADANHELDWVIVSEPAPPPHLGPGQVRTGDCSTATDWHYIPSGDKVTGGGSLVASSDGSRLMLTDQHCKNVDARPGDRIIVYDPTVGSCGGQLPSNQAFALNGTRLVVQQNGECVSASECDTRDSAAPLSRCITAEVCSDSTATTVGDFLQQWSWLNGTKKLQLLGLGEESGAFECLDVDMNATSTNATAATLYSHESGGCIKLATATDPSKCLGLAAVNGTTEYRTAALVPCSDPTVLWRYGSRYLNMTYGSLSNCHTALSLDASPRARTNVFAGPLVGGRWAALLINRGEADAVATLHFDQLPGHSGNGRELTLNATEVWSDKALGTQKGSLSQKLGKHESLFVILSP